MSANELEDLMSRLNTDSQNESRTNDLGWKIGDNGQAKESYNQEQTHTRHGRLRGRKVNGVFTPMPMKAWSEMDVSEYQPEKPYHPVFGKFVVNDRGFACHIPKEFVLDEHGFRKLPPGFGGLQTIDWTLDNLWALFWNEHWEKQALKRRLYNILDSRRNNSTNFGGFGGSTQYSTHLPAAATSAPGHVVAPTHTSNRGTHTPAAAGAQSWADRARFASYAPEPKPPPKPATTGPKKPAGAATGQPGAKIAKTPRTAGGGGGKPKGKDAAKAPP